MSSDNNIFKEWDIINKDVINYNEILKDTDHNLYKFLTNNTVNNLENLVLGISKFHINRLNIDSDSKLSIRYKIKTDLSENKLEFTSLQKVNPIISCFLYLNDSDNPYIFTDVELNDYKYKKASIYKNSITICFPRKFKHTTIENYNTGMRGEFEMFCSSSKEPSNIVIIDIFKDLSNNSLIINDTNTELIIIEKCGSKEVSIIDTTIYNDSLLEELLYTNTNNPIKSLEDIILKNEYNVYDTFVIKKQSQSEAISNIIINDSKNKTFDINLKKYIQRFVCEQIYNGSICDWIVNEIESYSNNSSIKFIKSTQINYPGHTISIDKITAIFSFILFSCTEIFNKVKSLYCIDYNFNIKEIFVLRYTGDSEDCIESSTSDSPFTINILLKNENSDNNSGVINFEDGVSVKMNKGDMLIHTNRTPHNYIPIKNGCIYSLLISFDVL
jgi:hypothetical protein